MAGRLADVTKFLCRSIDVIHTTGYSSLSSVYLVRNLQEIKKSNLTSACKQGVFYHMQKTVRRCEQNLAPIAFWHLV